MNREELIKRLRIQEKEEGSAYYKLDRKCFESFNLPEQRFICVTFELDEGDELYLLDGEKNRCISVFGDEEVLKAKDIINKDKRVKYINYEGY